MPAENWRDLFAFEAQIKSSATSASRRPVHSANGRAKSRVEVPTLERGRRRRAPNSQSRHCRERKSSPPATEQPPGALVRRRGEHPRRAARSRSPARGRARRRARPPRASWTSWVTTIWVTPVRAPAAASRSTSRFSDGIERARRLVVEQHAGLPSRARGRSRPAGAARPRAARDSASPCRRARAARAARAPSPRPRARARAAHLHRREHAVLEHGQVRERARTIWNTRPTRPRSASAVARRGAGRVDAAQRDADRLRSCRARTRSRPDEAAQQRRLARAPLAPSDRRQRAAPERRSDTSAQRRLARRPGAASSAGSTTRITLTRPLAQVAAERAPRPAAPATRTAARSTRYQSATTSPSPRWSRIALARFSIRLGQLGERHQRHQRAVLEQRDEVVGHRRDRDAHRLRADHVAERLPRREPERPRRLELAGRHALEAGAVVLRLGRRVVEAERERAGDERIERDAELGQTEVEHDQLHEQRRAAHELDVAGREPAQRRRRRSCAAEREQRRRAAPPAPSRRARARASAARRARRAAACADSGRARAPRTAAACRPRRATLRSASAHRRALAASGVAEQRRGLARSRGPSARRSRAACRRARARRAPRRAPSRSVVVVVARRRSRSAPRRSRRRRPRAPARSRRSSG